MTKPGHIEIKDNKVIFVYYKLEKLKNKTYHSVTGSTHHNVNYTNMKEYEALKRSVDVIGFIKIQKNNWKGFMKGILSQSEIWNDMPCEAEITDGKATIVKIL